MFTNQIIRYFLLPFVLIISSCNQFDKNNDIKESLSDEIYENNEIIYNDIFQISFDHIDFYTHQINSLWKDNTKLNRIFTINNSSKNPLNLKPLNLIIINEKIYSLNYQSEIKVFSLHHPPAFPTPVRPDNFPCFESASQNEVADVTM